MIALPITVTLAIQRNRLWDIDVIIRRALIYSALTAVLAALDAGIVILLQRLLPAQTQLTTVLSTLAIATLFNPLRFRIQHPIDRRFYRQEYDVERTLAAFGARARGAKSTWNSSERPCWPWLTTHTTRRRLRSGCGRGIFGLSPLKTTADGRRRGLKTLSAVLRLDDRRPSTDRRS